MDKNIKTILHYYWFSLDKPADVEKYHELCVMLGGLNLEKFASKSERNHLWYKDTIKPLDGHEVELETRFLYNNQWNTAPVADGELGLRVFDWAEAIYPDNNIKEGQWLEQTDEMLALRRENWKCHWCGEVTPKVWFLKPYECPICRAVGMRSLVTNENLLPDGIKEMIDGISEGEILAARYEAFQAQYKAPEKPDGIPLDDWEQSSEFKYGQVWERVAKRYAEELKNGRASKRL
jgi:hypothetical protein